MVDRSRRALVVSDNIEWAREALACLRRIAPEMDVESVSSDRAVEAAASAPHVLAWVDANGRGCEVTRRLRQRQCERELPVVFVSDEEDEEMPALAAGANAFVVRKSWKGVGSRYLEQLVETLAG